MGVIDAGKSEKEQVVWSNWPKSRAEIIYMGQKNNVQLFSSIFFFNSFLIVG